jgi:hypothetical protein
MSLISPFQPVQPSHGCPRHVALAKKIPSEDMLVSMLLNQNATQHHGWQIA